MKFASNFCSTSASALLLLWLVAMDSMHVDLSNTSAAAFAPLQKPACCRDRWNAHTTGSSRMSVSRLSGQYSNDDETPQNEEGRASACSENEKQQSSKKKGYQRIEDWEDEQNLEQSDTWHERVKFDGQRFGNQVRQNDILLRHLK